MENMHKAIYDTLRRPNFSNTSDMYIVKMEL